MSNTWAQCAAFSQRFIPVLSLSTTIRIFSLLLLFLAVGTAQSQNEGTAEQRIARMLRDASRALQAGNAARFLGYFNRARFPSYADLESNIVALTRQAEIASSIKVSRAKQSRPIYQVEIDWVLQLTPSSGIGHVEERRASITVRVNTVEGRSEIISLAPVNFFRSLGVDRPE